MSADGDHILRSESAGVAVEYTISLVPSASNHTSSNSMISCFQMEPSETWNNGLNS